MGYPEPTDSGDADRLYKEAHFLWEKLSEKDKKIALLEAENIRIKKQRAALCDALVEASPKYARRYADIAKEMGVSEQESEKEDTCPTCGKKTIDMYGHNHSQETDTPASCHEEYPDDFFSQRDRSYYQCSICGGDLRHPKKAPSKDETPVPENYDCNPFVLWGRGGYTKLTKGQRLTCFHKRRWVWDGEAWNEENSESDKALAPDEKVRFAEPSFDTSLIPPGAKILSAKVGGIHETPAPDKDEIECERILNDRLKYNPKKAKDVK